MGHYLDDPTLNAVLLECLQSFPDVDQLNGARFYNLMTDLALHFQGSVALFESGSLDEGTFEKYLDGFASIIATPGGAVFWERSRSAYPMHVVSSVEKRLEAGSVPDFLDNPFWGE